MNIENIESNTAKISETLQILLPLLETPDFIYRGVKTLDFRIDDVNRNHRKVYFYTLYFIRYETGSDKIGRKLSVTWQENPYIIESLTLSKFIKIYKWNFSYKRVKIPRSGMDFLGSDIKSYLENGYTTVTDREHATRMANLEQKRTSLLKKVQNLF